MINALRLAFCGHHDTTLLTCLRIERCGKVCLDSADGHVVREA